MEFFERLANQLPSLRNQIQLTGLIVLVAGFVMTRAIAPDQVLGQLSAGSIGILVIIFGTATPVLRIIPSAQRAIVLIAMLIALLILVIALALISVGLMTKAARANELQTSIGKNINSDFCPDAEKDARELIALDPMNWRSYNLSGQAKYCLHKWEEAVGEYEKALAIDENNERAMFNLGAALIKWECEDCFSRAYDVYNDLASRADDDLAIVFNLGLMQAVHSDYENALINAERVLNGGKAYGSFLLGVTKFLSVYAPDEDSSDHKTNQVIDLFREAERSEPRYICMLLEGPNVSNSYQVLVDRAKTYRAYQHLVDQMSARNWGKTC